MHTPPCCAAGGFNSPAASLPLVVPFNDCALHRLELGHVEQLSNFRLLGGLQLRQARVIHPGQSLLSATRCGRPLMSRDPGRAAFLAGHSEVPKRALCPQHSGIRDLTQDRPVALIKII